MNNNTEDGGIRSDYLEVEFELTLTQLCRACGVDHTEVVRLVEEGVLEPEGNDQTQWRFSAWYLSRALRAIRLQRDLGINAAGAALALELIDEIERLRGSGRTLMWQRKW